MSHKKALLSGILSIIILVAGVVFFKQSRSENNSDVSSDDSFQAEVGVNKSPAPIKSAASLPGANKINDEQKVITELGVPVKTDVMPNNPEAPQAVVVTKNKLPKSAVKIDISGGKFKPESFTVKAGTPVSLAFSSVDKKSHIITFSDSSLAALSFGVGAGQIKAMNFNAPETAGSYEFTCAVPGHKVSGEKGVMIVE